MFTELDLYTRMLKCPVKFPIQKQPRESWSLSALFAVFFFFLCLWGCLSCIAHCKGSSFGGHRQRKVMDQGLCVYAWGRMQICLGPQDSLTARLGWWVFLSLPQVVGLKKGREEKILSHFYNKMFSQVKLLCFSGFHFSYELFHVVVLAVNFNFMRKIACNLCM